MYRTPFPPEPYDNTSNAQLTLHTQQYSQHCISSISVLVILAYSLISATSTAIVTIIVLDEIANPTSRPFSLAGSILRKDGLTILNFHFRRLKIHIRRLLLTKAE